MSNLLPSVPYNPRWPTFPHPTEHTETNCLFSSTSHFDCSEGKAPTARSPSASWNRRLMVFPKWGGGIPLFEGTVHLNERSVCSPEYNWTRSADSDDYMTVDLLEQAQGYCWTFCNECMQTGPSHRTLAQKVNITRVEKLASHGVESPWALHREILMRRM